MTRRGEGELVELSAEETAAMLKAGEIVLIDVREPQEYAAERIHGALLYPLSTFDPAFTPDDGRRRAVLHCGSGKRSLMAASKLLQAGAPRATHMAGGINAWKEAGLPVVRIDPATGRVLDAAGRPRRTISCSKSRSAKTSVGLRT